MKDSIKIYEWHDKVILTPCISIEKDLSYYINIDWLRWGIQFKIYSGRGV